MDSSSKGYRVSKLGSGSPGGELASVVELRARQEDIFIPSVSLIQQVDKGGNTESANDSPRSIDSGHSALTSSTHQSEYKIVAGRAVAVPSGKKPAQSLGLPVQILKGKHRDKLMVEVSAASYGSRILGSPVSSQLSILEAKLPVDMQGYRKRVGTELMFKLQKSLSLSAFHANEQGFRTIRSDMDDNLDDDFSVGSEPKHFSSGSALSLFPQRHKTVAQGGLWGQPQGDMTMEEQERRFILNRERRALLDEMVSHVEESGKDVSNEADESLQGAVYADLDHQHHHRHRHHGHHHHHHHHHHRHHHHTAAEAGPAVSAQESVGDSSVGNDAFTASQSILSLGDGNAEGFGVVAPGQPEDGGDDNSSQSSSASGSSRSSRSTSSSRRPSISLALPVYVRNAVDIPNINLMSKTREKLQELGKFVLGHTYRKIILNWNIVDSRFQNSRQETVEMIREGAAGVTTPIKQPAMAISSLVLLLCSNQVRLTHKELPSLCSELGLTLEDVERARKIAAIRLCLGPEQGKGLNPDSVDILLSELSQLNEGHPSGPEKLVSVWRLKNVIFPQEAAERESLLRQIEEERSAFIRQQVEERQRRDDAIKRVEQRRQKLMQDYEESVRSIQFPKGPIKFEKLEALKELIVYCKKSYAVANLTKDITVAPESLALLGEDAFPLFVQQGIANKAGADSPTVKKNASRENQSGDRNQQQQGSSNNVPASPSKQQQRQRIGYEGQFRIRLQGDEPGSLTLLRLLREVVSYGKGLNGMAYRDVVEILQAYASTRLAARFRCNKRSWRYKAARIMWRKKFQEVQLRFYRAWAVFVRHVEDVRNYLWRKLKAWNFYTKRANLRREHFRINFWPFHVWHRYAASRRTATEKTKFLVGRVMPTYILLRHYRGWKRYFFYEKYLRETADDHVLSWKWRRGRTLFKWLLRWTRRRKRLRSAWYRHGIHSSRSKTRLCKWTPFMIWKTYWYYKCLMRARVKSISFQFRNSLLKNSPPIRPPTLLEKRELLRSRAESRKAAEEEAAEADDEEALVEGSEDGSSKTGDSKSKKSKRDKDKKKKKKKSKKGSKRGSGEDDDGEGESESESGRGSVREEKKKTFQWKMSAERDPMRTMDIPSDGEDDVKSPSINEGYATAVMPLPLGPELDFLIPAQNDDFVMNKVSILSRRFVTVDKLALLEGSMRYHRLMHRAFRNLFVFARVRRNSRNRTKKDNQKRKKKSFLAMLAWMLRDASAGINMDDQTDAEKVYYDAKSYRMEKMMKWRDSAILIKEVYGRDYDDPVMEKPGQQFFSKRSQQKKEKAKEKKALLMPDGITPFSPPDFLEWDRKDREVESEHAERMVLASKQLVRKVAEITATAQVESEMYNAAEISLKKTVDEVLETEDNITNAAVEAEMLYISQFKRHAADNLLSILCKVSREVDMLLMREQLKKYFRCLRMPMLERRGLALYNYKKIMNWIRVCKRLICISRNAAGYHRSRTMWVFYNRWLKLLEKETLDSTPGIIKVLARRKELLPKFSRVLGLAGFAPVPHANSMRLNKTVSTMRAIFFRWMQYTQEELNYRLMEEKVVGQFRSRLLQKCFYSLRTAMVLKDTHEMRMRNPPFVLTRIQADLDQIRKRFVAVRRRGLAAIIGSLNRRTVHYQIRDARRAPRFKSFVIGYRDEVNRRLVREQRILLEAFETRGTQEFVDLVCPEQKDPIVPGMMTRIVAPRFIDPHPEKSEAEIAAALDEDGMSEDRLDYDRLPPLPGGFKLCKIRVNHSVDMGQANGIQGIVGWQLVWSADGCSDVEGPKRGRWKGAAMKVHELTIPREEFVVGLEYIYEGISILGLRVKLHFSGFSRWLGDKPTLSMLSVYLGPELAPMQAFEADYTSPGRDEDESPAMPRAFIIGFSGLEFQGRMSCMTLVVRKIKAQHIFSYFWVEDALNQRAGSDFVAGRSDMGQRYDVTSLPSQLDVGAPDFDPRLVGDSVTDASKYGKNRDRSESTEVRLPPIAKAATAAAAGATTTGGSADSVNDDDRSIGDMSSISHGSKGAGGGGDAVPSPTGSKIGGAAAKTSVAGGASIISELQPRSRSLTSPEEQFFDLFRMRLMEIKGAERRAEQFARRLWTARQIKDDPQLGKLTSIAIIAPLTRWYFAGICKRVVKALPTEAQGEEMLEEAKKLLRDADRLRRRSFNEVKIAAKFENTPQVWQAKLALGPADRALKKAWTESLKQLKAKAHSTRLRSVALAEEADRKNKMGKMLLPRMCLSSYICKIFGMKVAAARHKELLLQSGMDFEAIKVALEGGGGMLAELTDAAMDMLRYSLANRKPNHSDPLALDKLVEAEVLRMRKQLGAQGERSGSQAGWHGDDGSSIASSSVHSIPSQATATKVSRPPAQTQQALVLPATFLPVVSSTGPQLHSDGRSVSSYHPVPTKRKKTGINTPLMLSASASGLFKLGKPKPTSVRAGAKE